MNKLQVLAIKEIGELAGEINSEATGLTVAFCVGKKQPEATSLHPVNELAWKIVSWAEAILEET